MIKNHRNLLWPMYPLNRGKFTTNLYVYDGAQVIADLNATGGLVRTYVWGAGIDNLLAMTVHTGATVVTYYPIKDHLGTVHALVNESGAIVERYEFDGFGRLLGAYDGDELPIKESAAGNRYLWQGREYSWATGLYYFRARWYDPVTDRWLSKDPIGISAGLNQYVFCGNSPVNARDPFGLVFSYAKNPEIANALSQIRSNLKNLAKTGSPQERIDAGRAFRLLAEFERSISEVDIIITDDVNEYDVFNKVIYWNPECEEGGEDVTGNRHRPPYVGLAHEVGHAIFLHNSLNINWGKTKPWNPAMKNVAEERAVWFENLVRKGAGGGLLPLNPRPAY